MSPKSSDPSNYSLDEMMDRLREGDREKRGSENSELVTRPDGSKVMRVRKRKRRSDQPSASPAKEKRSLGKASKVILFGVLGVALLALLVFCLLQLAKFNSESFHSGFEEKVSNTIGGTVSIARFSVTPLKARAERVVMTWPEESILESAQFNGVEAGVGLTGFFGGQWDGEQVSAKSGEIRIVGGLASQYPVSNGALPFGYDEFLCDRLTLILGAGKKPPVMIEDVELSVRREEHGRQIVIHGGTAAIRGWGEMAIGNGAMRFEEDGCWLSTLRLKPSEGRGDIILKSTEAIRSGQATTLEMELINVSLGYLLGSKVGALVDGRVDASAGLVKVSPSGFAETSLMIPVQGQGGTLRGFPFLISLRTVLSDTEYAKPTFRDMTADIHRVGDEVRIENLVMTEKGFMEVRGNMAVSAAGALSGTLRIGIHENKAINSAGRKRSLAFSDPKGGYVWFDLELGGTIDVPEDNWKMLLQQAARDGAALRRAESERRSNSPNGD